MKLFLLTEPYFADGAWGARILSGVSAAARAKKTALLSFPDSRDREDRDGESAFVLLIGSNPAWIARSVARAAECAIRPILVGAKPPVGVGTICGSVASEVGEGMRLLLGTLAKEGRERPALFGCNPESASDIERKSHFLASSLFPTTEDDVFFDAGSLSKCFSDFAARADRYDSVVCANGFAALYLIRSLSASGRLPRFRIAAFGETALGAHFRPDLLTVSAQYEQYGRAALSVCELLAKNPELTAVSVAVGWKSSIDRSDLPAATIPPDADPAIGDRDFYADGEMAELLKLERMLRACDESDRRILDLALCGTSNETIAERCFLSEHAVKYRLKKLRELSGCSSKSELLHKLAALSPLRKPTEP